MNSFSGGKAGDVLIVHLRRGDLVLESLQKALAQRNIKNAILLGMIGSLEKTEMHRVVTNAQEPQDEYVTVTEPAEISSAQGVVLDGVPHIHFVFSTTKETYTGHMEPGTQTLYLVEITLVELPDCQVRRVKDDKGIAYFTQDNQGA